MVVSVKEGQQCVYPFVLVADNGDMCASSDKDDKSVSPYTCIATPPDMGQLYACIVTLGITAYKSRWRLMLIDAVFQSWVASVC